MARADPFLETQRRDAAGAEARGARGDQGREGAGEVQTPLQGEAARALAIGDRVWFRHATDDQNGPIAEVTEEDLNTAVDAAEAVGDDRIQKKMQGQVSPESFTHGTSAQRHAWLQQGFSTGDPNKCNTFSAGTL